jgi:Holliday junction DNA helicase RuvA
MIGFIEGRIKVITEDCLVILSTGGVGYSIFCPSGILAKKSLNDEASLFVETIVKEDSITLFGFENYKDLIWFRSLLKVSGVGSKTALLILSSFKVADIIFAIENEQKEIFTSVSGIGEKLALRLINEMKKEPKKNTAILTSTLISGYNHEQEKEVATTVNSIVKDASLALESLGFTRQATFGICNSIFNQNPQISLNDLIKQSLKALKD